MLNALSRRATLIAAIVLTGMTCCCTAGKQPSKVETALANMAKDVANPIQAESVANLVPSIPEAISEGGGVYTQSCVLCHGLDGRGQTALGQNMGPPAMDLNSPLVQHWTDAELFSVIRNGARLNGVFAWQSTHSEPDTWRVVDFLLKSAPAELRRRLRGLRRKPGWSPMAAPLTARRTASHAIAVTAKELVLGRSSRGKELGNEATSG